MLYFGVLYHMVNPIEVLKRVRQVTSEVAVIDMFGIAVPGYPDASLVNFYVGNELNYDYGNWFGPSAPALVGMCRSAGFRERPPRGGPPRTPAAQGTTGLGHGERDPVPQRFIAYALV